MTTSNYSSLCDDHYINLNLTTEMDLPQNREVVLSYFDQIKKQHPTMAHFSMREGAEGSEYILEEPKGQSSYRWATLAARRLCAGQINPEEVSEVFSFYQSILELAPYALSLNSFDCEAIGLTFGFDFTYQGNHNELVNEALGLPPAFEHFPEKAGSAGIVNYEPAVQIALDEEGRSLCRLSIETRTDAYHLRDSSYPGDQISVYLTARHNGSLREGQTYGSTLRFLAEASQNLIHEYVVENILQPLQQTIAIK
ncbi:MAG: hypothetical protein MPJ24_07190 [Pirellulaceae bacterium]|nr:hypothetical protein [Pirellulaceae bacterium]